VEKAIKQAWNSALDLAAENGEAEMVERPDIWQLNKQSILNLKIK